MTDYEEVTIRIKRGLIPDGYEAYEFCVPKEGETYITDVGQFAIARIGACGPRLILRRKWEWPPWLKCPEIKWINISSAGCWRGLNVEEGRFVEIPFCSLDWPEPPDRTKVYRRPTQ